MKLKAIFLVATLAFGAAAFAQVSGSSQGGPKRVGPGAQGGPGGPSGQMRMRTPEERVERLSKALNLNADQKKKILAIYKASGDKGKALFEDKKMTQEQKRAAFDKMREENAKKIKAVLTKDQAKKFDEMRQRGPGGPGGPGGMGRPGGTGKGGPPAGGKGGSGKGG
ncbi:MAG: hypothetical protein IT203_07475 [Fimbriimonadaceae bacterium]|nr:hypothetical protein [Fimbriimonadaceae bacterium]